MTKPLAISSGVEIGRVLFLIDVGFVLLTWPLAIRTLGGEQPAWQGTGVLTLLLYPLAYLLFLYALGLYRRDALAETRQSLGRVPFAAGLGGLVASVLAALAPWAGDSAGHPAIPALFAAAVVGLSAAGAAARILLSGLCRIGCFRRRVLVIGAGRRAWDLAWLLRKEGRTPAYDLIFVHGPTMGELDRRLARNPANRILPAEIGFLQVAREVRPDHIVVAPDERRGLDMAALLGCRTAGFPVSEYLRFLEREIGRIDLKRLEMGWLLFADGFNASLLDRALKRLLDIVLSLGLIVVTGPLLLIAALAVKGSDGGPVLYSQARVTQGSRVFRILKLRTMRVDAERGGATWAAQADPRVTPVGRFLRRTRIDELPQLVNVLSGAMAFVGPRPERPEFVTALAPRLPLYDERHRVKAGLTGWAQVNYPYGASLDDARSKLSYDLYYVKNAGVLLDLLIIAQTLRVVLWPGDGVR